MNSLLQELKEDRVFIQIKQMVKTTEASVDNEKIIRECRLLHSQRKSPNLFKYTLEPTKLHDALMTDLSNRARLTELKATLYVTITALETALKEGRNHVRSQYSDEIKELASNAPDRTAILDKIFNKGLTVLSSLKATAEVLDIYLKDIDQAQWGLRADVDLIKVITERKQQVV